MKVLVPQNQKQPKELMTLAIVSRNHHLGAKNEKVTFLSFIVMFVLLIAAPKTVLSDVTVKLSASAAMGDQRRPLAPVDMEHPPNGLAFREYQYLLSG